MIEVHCTKWNAYHPAPGSAWTVHDAQMPEETIPCCPVCGRCDCPSYDAAVGHCADNGDESCEGLYFAYVHADGQILCEQCADQAGIRIVGCECPDGGP
jgi:hypothetical protein